jgi:uncharacterized membrane protein
MPPNLDNMERVHDDAPVAQSKADTGTRELLAECVTINRAPADLYAFWRNPANLVQIMDNIESIEMLDDVRSRWTVKAPAGRTVSWESVITHDVEGQEITWQSAPDADVSNSGRIEFIGAGDRGTIVRATIAYDPPFGTVGKLIAKLFQREPKLQARRDLRRFKQLMETGEVATAAHTRKQLEEERS